MKEQNVQKHLVLRDSRHRCQIDLYNRFSDWGCWQSIDEESFTELCDVEVEDVFASFDFNVLAKAEEFFT